MDYTLPAATETGKLNVMHLKRYWGKAKALRQGKMKGDDHADEWATDVALLSTLGLGLEQTVKYLYNDDPDFETLEDWILEVNNGLVSQEKIERFNTKLTGAADPVTEGIERILSDEDLAFWDANGYIILRNAVSLEECDQTVALICQYLDIDRNDPSTWYNVHKDRQGIMVQLFQHPLLQKNRDNELIRKAYEQLWNRKDIMVNTDRVGFNPPETETYRFPGPRLHWDVSLDLPMPFGTQGILYLVDTAANQGAFTLIPGFNNTLESWLMSLPPDANPRTQDLYALNPMPIAANAGDFILWHQALPHGSSPNTHHLSRFVQYINYYPIDAGINKDWK